MVLKLLKNIFSKKKKSNKNTPTASYQVQNDQASLEHNCTSKNVLQSTETTTQNIEILDAKINHVTNAISLLEIEACEGTIPKWIQLLADFNTVYSHSKPSNLVFQELCQLNHEIRITKFDNSVSNVVINQINFVTHGDDEANNSAFVMEYLVKLNEFLSGFKKRSDSFYGGMPCRIIDEMLTAQPEMISSSEEFSSNTNSYSATINILYLIECTAQSDKCQVDACNEAKLKAFGFLKQFDSQQKIVNLYKDTELTDIQQCSDSILNESSSDVNDENLINVSGGYQNYLVLLRKLICAINAIRFEKQIRNFEIIDLLNKKEVQVEVKALTIKNKGKQPIDYIVTIRIQSLCLSFTERSMISQEEAENHTAKVFIQFLHNLKVLSKTFKREYKTNMDSIELIKILIKTVPDLIEIHKTPYNVIIEVKKLKAFQAKISNLCDLKNAEVEAAKKLIDFLRNIQFDDFKQTFSETENQNFAELEINKSISSQNVASQNLHAIHQRSELIKNFNQVNEKNKSPIEIINKLKVIDKTNKIAIDIRKQNSNNFTCYVKIKNITTFTANAKSELESRVEAAQKTVDYLQNIVNLIIHFRSAYMFDESTLELVNELRARNSKIFKIAHSRKIASFETVVDIVNFISIRGKGDSAPDAKANAFIRLIDYLKKLSGINKEETLSLPSYFTKVNLESLNSSNPEYSKSIIDKLNDEIFSSFLRIFKCAYSHNEKPLKIIKILFANFPELIQINSIGSTGHFRTSVTIKGVVTLSNENEFREATKRNVSEKVVEFLRQFIFEQPSTDLNELKFKNQIKTLTTTKIEQDDPAIVTSVSNLSSLRALFQCYRSECVYEISEAEILDSLLDKCASDIILKHSQSGPAHQPEHRIELLLVNASKTFTATAKRKLVAKEKVAQKLVNYFRMCLRLEQTNLRQCIQVENMNLDDKTSKKIYDAVRKQWASVPLNYQKIKVLAAFVVTSNADPNYVRVLTIGSGTKCITSDAKSRDGKVVFDSHAEVIARRALVRLLYEHLEDLLQKRNNPQNVLERSLTGEKFCLKRSLKLHLYISTPPCGASFKYLDDKLRVKVEAIEGYHEMPVSYISNLNKIEDGQQKSTFMTCSDKIAMWNVVGVQGALLSHFIQPIYLDSLIVSDYFDYNSITRAIYDRVDSEKLIQHLGHKSPGFMLNRHKVGYYRPNNHYQLFDFSLPKRSPNSYNWFRTLSTQSNSIETINSRTGVLDNGQTSRLSKLSFAKRFKRLLEENHLSIEDNKMRTKHRGTYWYIKEQADAYQNAKGALVTTIKESQLGVWINAYGGEMDFFLVE